MAWHKKAKKVRHKVATGAWHPCGFCIDRYCGKKGDVTRASVAAFARDEPVADCSDRVKPYWEVLND